MYNMQNETKHSEIHKPHLPFLVFICIASALGGLLWGFDAIVISGTISSVKVQFALSPAMEGFFVSSGLLGAVFGSGLSGWLSDKFGRSRNLLLAAVLMLLSALGSAWATNIEFLVFARWLGDGVPAVYFRDFTDALARAFGHDVPICDHLGHYGRTVE